MTDNTSIIATATTLRTYLRLPHSINMKVFDVMAETIHHITSHGEDGCRTQRPLYARNNCLWYEFI